MYIIKYANLHQMVTGKRPEQETDQSHLDQVPYFHKITWKYPEKSVDEEYLMVLHCKTSS